MSLAIGVAPSRISVVMPAYNAAALLGRTLAPLLAMREKREVVEVILVDDGSSDATARTAAALGATVVGSGGRLGPGGARNRGATLAQGDVLWFVDADVIVHEDAARRVAEVFRDETVMAAFGSYDDAPPAANFLSQYKNLLHHFHHQQMRGRVDTFWAGCGAVRKSAFVEVGGFDALRYPRPSIEDIDLGWRLAAGGAGVEAVPELLGTHLKRWGWRDLLATDILHRALPWAKLIVRGAGPSRILNVSMAERGRALIALLLAASIVAAAGGGVSPWWCAVLAATAGLANRALFAFFRRRRGWAFALGALAFHQLYYLYSAAVFAWCWSTRGASPEDATAPRLGTHSRSRTTR